MEKTKLRKVEIRQLKRKLNEPVSKKLLYYRDVLKWTGVEIMEVSGLVNSRQTEIINYTNPKYIKGGMTEKLLAGILERSFITLTELKKLGNFTKEEIEYLDDNFMIYDDRENTQVCYETKTKVSGNGSIF